MLVIGPVPFLGLDLIDPRSSKVNLLLLLKSIYYFVPFFSKVNKIFRQNAGGELSYDDWQSLGRVGANIGQDLLVAGSVGKILG